MKNFEQILYSCILTFVTASACKEVRIQLNYGRNCIDDDSKIVALNEGFKMIMLNNCSLYSAMCYTLKPYNTAMLEITFIKEKTRLFQEKIDLCNRHRKGKEMTQVILRGMGLQFNCPNSKNMTHCEKERKVLDFNTIQRGMLRTLYGKRFETVKVRAEIVHDTGKSCIETEVKIGLK